MNTSTIFILILTILVFDFLLEKTLSILNIVNRKKADNAAVKDLYSAEEYTRFLEYESAKDRVGIMGSLLSITLIICLLCFDGFAWLDGELRSYTLNEYGLPMLYFATLFVVNDLIGLPFDLYGTFVIEEKFGFNKMTLKTFLLDKLKSYLLVVVIGGGLGIFILWFYYTTGAYFWLLTWLILSLFGVIVSMFYTSLIMPLFNKLSPLAAGSLKDKIEAYSKKVGFPLTGIFVMDGSKRSTKANAFFSGLGSEKKIVLYDTLINEQSEEEILAVLAHEVGHYKKKHIRNGLFISLLYSGLQLYLLSLFLAYPIFSEALGFTQHSFHAGILVFGFLYSPIGMIIGMGMKYLSRQNEYEADAYARTTYSGAHLIESLKKLHVKSLSDLNPHNAYVFFYYSHPSLVQRIRALEGGSL